MRGTSEYLFKDGSKLKREFLFSVDDIESCGHSTMDDENNFSITFKSGQSVAVDEYTFNLVASSDRFK